MTGEIARLIGAAALALVASACAVLAATGGVQDGAPADNLHEIIAAAEAVGLIGPLWMVVAGLTLFVFLPRLGKSMSAEDDESASTKRTLPRV